MLGDGGEGDTTGASVAADAGTESFASELEAALGGRDARVAPPCASGGLHPDSDDDMIALSPRLVSVVSGPAEVPGDDEGGEGMTPAEILESRDFVSHSAHSPAAHSTTPGGGTLSRAVDALRFAGCLTPSHFTNTVVETDFYREAGARIAVDDLESASVG